MTAKLVVTLTQTEDGMIARIRGEGEDDATPAEIVLLKTLVKVVDLLTAPVDDEDD